MRSAADQYLLKVNKWITCPGSLKKPFLSQLKEEILFFCSEHSDVTVEMLSAQFGAPEEVAEEFLSELGTQAVDRYTRTRKRLQHLTFCVSIAVAILAVLIGARTYFLQQQLPEGEFVASITYETESDSKEFWFLSQDTIFGNSGDDGN